MTISEWRKKKGMTQKQLAMALGTDQSLISKWESGTHSPTMRSALKIMRLTKNEVTVADLVRTAKGA